MGILDEQWKTCCPSCLADLPEILRHFLCECTRWDSKRLDICGSTVKLLFQITATLGCFYGFHSGRLVATNSLEENSSTTVEMQEKKVLDETIH